MTALKRLEIYFDGEEFSDIFCIMEFTIYYIYDGWQKKVQKELPSLSEAQEFCAFEESRLQEAGSDVSVVLA